MGPWVIAENVCSYCILFACELRANFLQDCFMERREFLKKAAATTVVTSLRAKLLRGATDSFPDRVLGPLGRESLACGAWRSSTSAADRKQALLFPSKQGKIRYVGFTGQRVRTFAERCCKRLLLTSSRLAPCSALNLPTSVVITGCESPAILQQALEAAVSFKAMGNDEVAQIAGQNGVRRRY